MRKRSIKRVARVVAGVALLLGATIPARAEESSSIQFASGIAAPTMFAIERNYGPIEERTERIPAQLIGAPPFVPMRPIGWGWSWGPTRPWYGYYYGPRMNYGYGGPYISVYRPYYGHRAYYGYGYSPYAGYRPYGTFYYRSAPITAAPGPYSGCYYW